MRGTDILDTGSWCILRCASADTLKVAKALNDAGLEVWTPIEPRIGRMPKTRARYDKEAALMPSYAFGHVDCLDELLRLAMIPHREMPRFSVFHYRDGIPLVADDQLKALRTEESRLRGVFERWKRKGKKGPKIERGSEVKLTEGPFAGMSGIVEGQEGQFTLVDMNVFGKSTTIKIASLLLAENVASDGLPIMGTAARAA